MENQKKMENQKRKQQQVNGGGGESRRTKSRDDNGGKTATEAEVEEFFAILRQLHSAVRQLRKDDGSDDVVVLGVGGRSKLREDHQNNNINKGSSWKPVFEWADFEETTNKTRTIIKDTAAEREIRDHNHQHLAQDKKEGVEENLVGFDLNAEPESET